jgi:hypothetical protein
MRHGLNMHYTNPKKCSNDSCDHVFDSVQYKHGKSAISFCPKCRTKNELKTAEIIENVDRRDLTHNAKLTSPPLDTSEAKPPRFGGSG